MDDNVIELRPRQTVKLVQPLDMYICQLEARVISALAHHLVTGDDQHLAAARINCVQRAQRLGSADGWKYFDEVYAALCVLPETALAQLYHPARAYSRKAQQDVINRAQAAS